MTDAMSNGRVGHTPSASRKRGDNLELINKRAPPSLCLASLPAPSLNKPASARTAGSAASSTTTTTSSSSDSATVSAAPATSRRFSLFGARRQKRTMSCAVEMLSPSPGLGLADGGGDMTSWDDFQKRYRMLGLDDGADAGGPGSEHDVERDLLQPVSARTESRRVKEKGGSSRGRRHQLHLDMAIQQMQPNGLFDGSSPRSPRGSDSATDRDLINGRKEKKKEKKEKKEKKKKKEKKEKDLEKKEKRKEKKEKKEKGKKSKDSDDANGAEADEEGTMKRTKSGSAIEPGEGSLADGKKRGLTLRARMGMRMGSHDVPILSARATGEKDKRDSPLLGSLPAGRLHPNALHGDDASSMLLGNRKRQASSPARVQVGRWERRTFHSGEMGGNDAVLSQLLKMAENIKKGQESCAEDFRADGSVRSQYSDEEIDFANQEAEVRRVVQDEAIRRLDEAIARERRMLKKVEARIRRAEKKLRKKRGAGILSPDLIVSSPADS